ncbi:MAG: LytR C-terminal domain-containing protein [Rhodocyclaceae bacterium]|nr:LytR C-terminal domain-containing protein [Rhodocyclaceae bacterium]
MKLRRLTTVLAAALSAGCAGTLERDLAWEVKPHMDVRHGMKQVQAQYQLGRYFQGQGRDALAEKAYRQALAIDHTHVESINALATLLAARGELEEASRWFEKLVAQAPDRAYLHNNAGYALFLQGRHAEAVTELRTAVGLDPRFERAWINLEQAARAAGMTALAEQAASRGRPVAVATVSAAPSTDMAPPPAARTLGDAVVRIALGKSADVKAAKELPLALSRELKPAPAPTMIARAELASTTGVVALPVTAAVKPEIAPLAMREVPFRALDSAATVPGTRASEPNGDRAAASPAPIIVKVGLAASTALADARLEISNGNGVRRFAGRVAAMLKAGGLDVRRINNYESFGLARSQIEYRPGFEAAARALAGRIGVDTEITETAENRWGSDVRLILGADATLRKGLRT